MKRYNRGIRLAKKPKAQLELELANAIKQLARLDFYVVPDSRMAHIPSWLIHARRNTLSRIGRIRAAMRIQDDNAFLEMIQAPQK